MKDTQVFDWRELFAKYAGRVGHHEGVLFLYERDWTPEEWAEIKKLMNEAGMGDAIR